MLPSEATGLHRAGQRETAPYRFDSLEAPSRQILPWWGVEGGNPGVSVEDHAFQAAACIAQSVFKTYGRPP